MASTSEVIDLLSDDEIEAKTEAKERNAEDEDDLEVIEVFEAREGKKSVKEEMMKSFLEFRKNNPQEADEMMFNITDNLLKLDPDVKVDLGQMMDLGAEQGRLKRELDRMEDKVSETKATVFRQKLLFEKEPSRWLEREAKQEPLTCEASIERRDRIDPVVKRLLNPCPTQVKAESKLFEASTSGTGAAAVVVDLDVDEPAFVKTEGSDIKYAVPSNQMSKRFRLNDGSQPKSMKPKTGDTVYANFTPEKLDADWKLGAIEKKSKVNGEVVYFVKSLNGTESESVQLSIKNLAFYKACPELDIPVRTRVIARLTPDTSDTLSECSGLFSGFIAETPANYNKERYLILFDSELACYIFPHQVYKVFDGSLNDAVNSVSFHYSYFLRKYFNDYPEKALVKIQLNEKIRMRFGDGWVKCRVQEIDCNVIKVSSNSAVWGQRTDWVYRGSSRLQPVYIQIQQIIALEAKRQKSKRSSRPRAARRTEPATSHRIPFIQYTVDRSDDDQQHPCRLSASRVEEEEAEPEPEQEQAPEAEEPEPKAHKQKEREKKDQVQEKSIIQLNQRVKKGTSSVQWLPQNLVYSQPRVKNLRSGRIAIEPKHMVSFIKAVEPRVIQQELLPTHVCSTLCLRGKRKEMVIEEHFWLFRGYNPFAIPLLLGWKREQIVRSDSQSKKKRNCYSTPCGKRVMTYKEINMYLVQTNSMLTIDLFTLETIDISSRKGPMGCQYYVQDLSGGREAQPVSVVNTIDCTPVDTFKYSAERIITQHTETKLNANAFLSFEGIKHSLLVVRDKDNVARFNPDFLPCCDCKDDCRDALNCRCQQYTEDIMSVDPDADTRVKGYQNKRLFKPMQSAIYECNSNCPCTTRCPNRVAQMGIRVNLQLFKTADKGWGVRVLQDIPKGAFICIYAAEILPDEVVETEDCDDKYLADLDYIDILEDKMKRKEGYESSVEEDSSSDESQKSIESDDEEQDDDYGSGYRSARKKRVETGRMLRSDTAKALRKERKEKPFKSLRSLYSEQEFYSLDAKRIGNIGRYFNHSCSPNCFVQNVFVDSHDPRFPWIALFSMQPIKALEELNWDYSYIVGSIFDKGPDGTLRERKMWCYCGSEDCRGRLL